ncbi:flagellar assembly peptidoglycan hydrolase FlgJ [Maricurvus nonylphenolicus]|uniref:flagellar assembly peptidoglycan hydrolase FlgJ n=1 Tax=Maricurvus nonylphenolicus TaxID=1008307 RepID=UPI0036F3BC8B
MIPFDSNSVLHQAQQSSYTDLTDLQSIKREGRENKEAALEKIAQQFESIMLQTMLKTMREANDVFAEDSYFNSSEMKFHQDMFDHQLGLSLSQGKGLGIADAFIRQMKQQYLSVEPNGLGNNGPMPLDKPFKGPEKAGPSTIGVKQPMAISPEEFVAKVKPYADKAAESLGVDSRVLIAQAALETGWGRHVIHRESGESSFNLFNIKAGSDWQQDQVSVSTIEFNHGVARHEQAQFRVYPDMAASFEDYTAFIGERQRYAAAVDNANNPYAYLKELQAAGYATDPEYANKVWRVFNSEAVQQASSDVVTARKD